MKYHVNDWIDAYVHGELSGELLEQIESHLAGCADCRLSLEEHHQLSRLLAEWKAPEAVVGEAAAAEVFAARLQRRLTANTSASPWKQALKRAWQLSPAGMIAFWAFGQAVIIITQVALFLAAGRLELGSSINLGRAFNPTLNTAAFLYDAAAVLMDGGIGLSDGLLIGEGLVFGILLSLWLSGAVAVLLSGWVASWWVFKPLANSAQAAQELK